VAKGRSRARAFRATNSSRRIEVAWESIAGLNSQCRLHSAGKLQHDLLRDSVPRRQQRGLRELCRRLLANLHGGRRFQPCVGRSGREPAAGRAWFAQHGDLCRAGWTGQARNSEHRWSETSVALFAAGCLPRESLLALQRTGLAAPLNLCARGFPTPLLCSCAEWDLAGQPIGPSDIPSKSTSNHGLFWQILASAAIVRECRLVVRFDRETSRCYEH
jgi:hypothetical protein